MVFFVRQHWQLDKTIEGGQMKRFGKCLAWCIPAFFIVGIVLATDSPRPENMTVIERVVGENIVADPAGDLNATAGFDVPYSCNLKVYMVEIESRYKDNTNYYRYDYGLLDFAFDTVLNLGYEETFQQTKIWDAKAAGFASNADSIFVTQENMMAIAVVFNEVPDGVNYSDPWRDYHPLGAPFDIHNVDACAAATHGSPGYDTAYGSSTHTVFVEEGTAYT